MGNYKVTPKNITELKDDEVFVFGSNESGFHGAGAAGFAFRYDNSCNWRQDTFFLEAMNNKDDPDKVVGKWAIFGKASGFHYGKEGKSYSIITIKKPGLKRSRPLHLLSYDIGQFLSFATSYKHLKFYVTEIGTNLAGYTVEEIAPLFKDANTNGIENVYLPESFIKVLEDE